MTNHDNIINHPAFAALSPEARQRIADSVPTPTVEAETKHYDTTNISPFTVTTVSAPRMVFSRFVNDDEGRRPHSRLALHGVRSMRLAANGKSIVILNEDNESITIDLFPAEGGMAVVREGHSAWQVAAE